MRLIDIGYIISFWKFKMKCYKVLVIGHSAVGKTQLINTACGGKFTSEYNPTYLTNITNLRIKDIHIDIWDQTNNTNKYSRNPDGVIFVFDPTNHRSYGNIESYIKLYKHVPFVICSTKSDIGHISIDHYAFNILEKRWKDRGIYFVRTSSKLNSNTTKPFLQIIHQILEKNRNNDYDHNKRNKRYNRL